MFRLLSSLLQSLVYKLWGFALGTTVEPFYLYKRLLDQFLSWMVILLVQVSSLIRVFHCMYLCTSILCPTYPSVLYTFGPFVFHAHQYTHVCTCIAGMFRLVSSFASMAYELWGFTLVEPLHCEYPWDQNIWVFLIIIWSWDSFKCPC